MVVRSIGPPDEDCPPALSGASERNGIGWYADDLPFLANAKPGPAFHQLSALLQQNGSLIGRGNSIARNMGERQLPDFGWRVCALCAPCRKRGAEAVHRDFRVDALHE